jgi:hypothetical protein
MSSSRIRATARDDAYPPNCDFGSVRRRARRSAALGRQSAILSSLLAASTVLADLRGGRRSRYRHDNHHRSAPSAHGGAALLLRVLRAVALLPTAGLLRAAELFWATLSPSVSRRWHSGGGSVGGSKGRSPRSKVRLGAPWTRWRAAAHGPDRRRATAAGAILSPESR